MNRLHRVAAALVLSGTLVPAASAQSSPPSAVQSASTPGARAAPAAATAPAQTPSRRRSIVHHYPYPYPSFYDTDATAGFRNPGGTGRYLEYYPPGNQFQIDQARDPVKVATFGQGGIPDRADQLAAQQIGIQRYNAIQNHIDNYARPYWGYGFGVGYFGGFF
ncbi:MAG TPA: hypothetical protein VKP69_30815 [Isosphaeraceae bacterium]|jgi:hypothetical protein|nr:hypothetical protein [Isosphaeraceae bacterium]